MTSNGSGELLRAAVFHTPKNPFREDRALESFSDGGLLQAYQRLADGVGSHLSPAHLLYLATRAGAEAVGLDQEIGDFAPGKSADFVYLTACRQPPRLGRGTCRECRRIAGVDLHSGRRRKRARNMGRRFRGIPQ